MQRDYLQLKVSWELFQKGPDALSEPELQRVRKVAIAQERIEMAILASREAASVIVPAATLANRLDEIRQRYAAEDEFRQDMLQASLDKDGLAEAVERDLRVEAVLDRVAADAATVSSVDAEIYYRLHPEAFDRPETRRLRHILITFNSPTEKARVLALLESLRNSLDSPAGFAKAALRHSQCPTAVNGGDLGMVKRKQLYPELEAAAFALAPGEISEVLESPIGLHILRCEEIVPGELLRFADVMERIIEHLTDKRRQEVQKSWIRSLGSASNDRSPMQPAS